MINWDKHIWKNEYLSSKVIAPWRCGKCWSGILQVIPNSFKKSLGSTNNAKLKCSNEHCNTRYSVNGIQIPCSKGHEVGNTSAWIDEYRLYVTHFQPELFLFELPSYLPVELQKPLIFAFNHFWYDLNACANKIRQVLELIMVSIGAKKAFLHQMILDVKEKLSPELYNDLLALKNIGNEGSHFSEGEFEKDDILIMFSVVVDVLNDFYPNQDYAKKRAEFIKRAIEHKGIKK